MAETTHREARLVSQCSELDMQHLYCTRIPMNGANPTSGRQKVNIGPRQAVCPRSVVRKGITHFKVRPMSGTTEQFRASPSYMRRCQRPSPSDQAEGRNHHRGDIGIALVLAHRGLAPFARSLPFGEAAAVRQGELGLKDRLSANSCPVDIICKTSRNCRVGTSRTGGREQGNQPSRCGCLSLRGLHAHCRVRRDKHDINRL